MRFHAIGLYFKFPTYPQQPILGWKANHKKLYQKVSTLDNSNNISMRIGQLLSCLKIKVAELDSTAIEHPVYRV